MNRLLGSQIVEGKDFRRLWLDEDSLRLLGFVLGRNGLSCPQVLRLLERAFGDETWPWAVVFLPRDLLLTAHFMEVRGVHRNLPLLSYFFIKQGWGHGHGSPSTGIVLIPSRGVGRRLAKVSPIIRAWWPTLKELPTDTTHLLMMDEPDAAQVTSLAFHHHLRVLAARRKRDLSDWPIIKAPCDRSQYLLQTAIALYFAKRDEAFLQHVDKLQAYLPNHPSLAHYKALTFLSMNRYQEALDTIRPVVIKHPAIVGGAECYGLAAEELGFHTLAEACFRRAVSLNFCSAVGWRGLFHCSRRRRNLEGMLEAIEPMEELEVPDSQAWVEVGSALIKAGRLDEAEMILEARLLKNPEDPFCMNNYAFVLAKQGRGEEGAPFCEAAIRCLPDNPLILDTQALILHQLGQTQKALDVIDRAIEIWPDWPDARETKQFIHATKLQGGSHGEAE